MPSLKITASAQARRVARGGLLRDDAPHRASASSPSAAITRSTCVASLQSTTRTRSTRCAPVAATRPAAARRRPRTAVPASAAWRSASAPISGCRMASSRRLRRGSANASCAHAVAVERAVGIDELGAERRAQRRHRRAAGLRSSWRAMASVSTSVGAAAAPACAATVLLPLPMPPVRPMRSDRCTGIARPRSGPAEPVAARAPAPASITTRPAPARNGPNGT